MTIQKQYVETHQAVQKDFHDNAKDKGFWHVQSAEEWLVKRESRLLEGKDSEGFTWDEMIEAYEEGQKNPPPNIAEKLMLIVSELAEGMEAIRKGNPESKKIPGYSHLTEELADADIRIKDLAEYLNLHLAEAEIAKGEYNKTRPYKHNKEF